MVQHTCSEATSSLSSVLPVLFAIIKNLEVKENDSTCIKRFKISVDNQIRSRWYLDNIDSSDIKLLAAALDPRHKALKFLSAEKTSEVKAELRDQIQQLQIANNTLNSNSESQPPTKKKAIDILFEKEESNAPVTMEDEVDLFFSETGAPRNSDPLAWWKANSLRYPRLS